MFKNLKLFLIFCLLNLNLKILTINNFMPGSLAIVQVPVADLLWESAQDLAYGQANISGPLTIYNNLGLGDSNCLRAYQLLLHETVLILEERGAEVKIAVPHIFYLAGSKYEPAQRAHKNLNLNNNLIANLEHLDQEYLNSFWTLKTNLIPVESLLNLGIDLNNLPTPINFKNNLKELSLAACNVNTATLIKSVLDPVTKQGYSVGTRFKFSGENLGNSVNMLNLPAPELLVWSLENSNNIPKLTPFALPADSYITYSFKSFTKQKRDFVNLIKSWANLNTGFVPYVYSGASLINTCPMGQCPIRSSSNILGQPGYMRENYTQEPSVGLDCSCLISRAAQIVGIPYFYKNSATIERNLVEIQDLADLEAGDIIWHTGHVMVISDVAQGLMVEARGYRQGFGCLHEVPISKIFYGVNSYADLLDRIKNKIPVRTLDDQGNFFGQIARFKLLKLVPGRVTI
jgi:hypothetical protein